MPIYEFKCEKCKKVQEMITDMTVKEVKCSCGGKAKKIMSPPGPVWKFLDTKK